MVWNFLIVIVVVFSVIIGNALQHKCMHFVGLFKVRAKSWQRSTGQTKWANEPSITLSQEVSVALKNTLLHLAAHAKYSCNIYAISSRWQQIRALKIITVYRYKCVKANSTKYVERIFRVSRWIVILGWAQNCLYNYSSSFKNVQVCSIQVTIFFKARVRL